MVLIIDNYDSFAFSLFQYVKMLGYNAFVKRNDRVSVDEIHDMSPSHIILSSGPGRPESAGICIDTVRSFAGKVPILGVGLGHQCIGRAFGAEIARTGSVQSGEVSDIEHDNKGIFANIRNPFPGTRYHSLTIRKGSMPEELEISAFGDDGEIMGLRHKQHNIVGLQFHPESIGSVPGYKLVENFLSDTPEELVMQPAIRKVVAGEDLSEHQSERVMDEITSGKASHAQIAALFTALSLKPESVSELTGFVRVMRNKATPVQKPEGKKVIDTCGTGGDSSGTFNISTLAALVTAGAGVAVAKHGNRSVTSRCGSADLLEALGVNIHAPSDVMTRALSEIGIAFLFAPGLHGSMKHALPARKEMGIRTAFNILGPLSNPAGADYQIVGVFDGGITGKVASVLSRLGVERAMVVHGFDGLDEITLTGPTKVSELRDGWIRDYELDPAELGLSYCEPDALKGGELKTNCKIALSILHGERSPRRDIVLLNSAAAIYTSGASGSMKSALDIAATSIDTGAAMKKLEQLIQYTGD